MIGLATISLSQAIGVWGDLVEAYHGVNGYGGNTAEIYMYRLMPRCPTAEDAARLPSMTITGAEAIAHRDREARAALIAIVRMFVERYADAGVSIDGLSIGQWEAIGGSHVRIRDNHRAYVLVERVRR